MHRAKANWHGLKWPTIVLIKADPTIAHYHLNPFLGLDFPMKVLA